MCALSPEISRWADNAILEIKDGCQLLLRHLIKEVHNKV